MDNKKLKHFEHLLLNEKKQHDHVLNNMKENDMGENDKYSATELSNYDNHPADQGTQVFDLEHGMALQVGEEYNLKKIDDALGRIKDGTYGKCELCGNQISEERLEIVPAARLCIKCEEERKLSMEYLVDGRPAEEDVISAPMGRRPRRSRDSTDTEHEGMDQFHDLMKYGSSDTPQDLGGYADYEEFYTNKIDNQGIVDDADKISNEDYEEQLPD